MPTKKEMTLEAAVIKSVVHAPLNIDEVMALWETDPSTLLREFDLTNAQLTKVQFWLKQQAQRLLFQEQMRPNRKLEESRTQKKRRLRRIVRNNLMRS